MNAIRENWAESKSYRVALILAMIYAILRLTVQVILFNDAIQPEAIAQGTLVSADLQHAYIPAAEHFKAREDIYLKGSLEVMELHFLYSPAFAFLYGPLLLLPLNILVPLMLIIHIVCYWLLFLWWDRIFRQFKLRNAEKLWAWSLPMFLLFSAFWDDVGLLNIYLIVGLFATFAIEAVLQERLGWSAFWLGAVILPIKPHWAFAAVLPLLLGRHRFFLKLILGTVLAYFAVVLATILGGGTEYVLGQYQDYFGFLARLSRDFPWWGPDKPFLGYNHSIKQIVVFYLGVTPQNLQLATVVKLLLLVPLGIVVLKFLRNPTGKSGAEIPETALSMVFALYLGAFIWLDMVWEVSLGLIVFVFLLSIFDKKWMRVLLWVIFAPYAFLDVWRLISYLSFGDNILYQSSYVLTDPFIYVPWIMMVLLLFYAFLLEKLTRYSLDPV